MNFPVFVVAGGCFATFGAAANGRRLLPSALSLGGLAPAAALLLPLFYLATTQGPVSEDWTPWVLWGSQALIVLFIARHLRQRGLLRAGEGRNHPLSVRGAKGGQIPLAQALLTGARLAARKSHAGTEELAHFVRLFDRTFPSGWQADRTAVIRDYRFVGAGTLAHVGTLAEEAARGSKGSVPRQAT
jgi:hypothetical protein